ncbi:CDP-diacylglycerol--glycerol-3-phosphate 3-phosphatidyltransferase [Oricola indica]|jgi:cardiolipin synthase|uniref:CDP-diacylglycerol--glycerol-3-phosphate 3-phosphatidyltransferase n=1 Tax=Oricola indica TaxID=2872591 RepID=UPI001CBBB7DA|nr:CDP-diacylglycerol--glycerol-3-phosphate 3-phosphatidyltransferase [Oricola indica]
MSRSAYNLPNILTYARILAVPLIVLCFFLEGRLQSSDFARWLALGIFIVASLTDFLDGYLARKWQQTSNIGRMLDPIADKLVVSVVLLLLAAEGSLKNWSLWAAVIILCREILVSGLREYLASLEVSVPVTWLAKWKTAIQLVAIGFLLAGPSGDKIVPYVTETGHVLLWISAIVTLYTGWDYFRSGLKHVINDEADR